MATDSYWCYTCKCFVQMHTDDVTCPKCTGGHVEQMDEPVRGRIPIYDFHRPTFADDSEHLTSPFNPVIALRQNNYFKLYYSIGLNMGLRPLPATISNLLKVKGLDRLLDQLLRIDATKLGHVASVDEDSMRVIKIEPHHVESRCTICMDPFELGSEAQQMPCKHVYHEDCILPWLSSNNSCPVCRHQMLPDDEKRKNALNAATIWRMSGDRFAVGHLGGPPVMYTESDGTFNNNVDALREIPRNTGSRKKNGFVNFFIKVFGCFRPSSSNSN